jgi:hypothetical protein
MKTSILSLALGIALASPVATYAGESPNPVNALEDLFLGSDHSHRAYHETVHRPSADPFKPRRTDGLSGDPNACVSYGCVGAGGGGD